MCNNNFTLCTRRTTEWIIVTWQFLTFLQFRFKEVTDGRVLQANVLVIHFYKILNSASQIHLMNSNPLHSRNTLFLNILTITSNVKVSLPFERRKYNWEKLSLKSKLRKIYLSLSMSFKFHWKILTSTLLQETHWLHFDTEWRNFRNDSLESFIFTVLNLSVHTS